jgi:hypothetical protein
MKPEIRQYIPKKTDFETIDNQYVEYIETKLNNRPRKKLGFLTPNENFLLLLHNQKVAYKKYYENENGFRSLQERVGRAEKA